MIQKHFQFEASPEKNKKRSIHELSMNPKIMWHDTNYLTHLRQAHKTKPQLDSAFIQQEA